MRQLLYDFRPWRDLEATGRSGSDEGFDARAWELTAQQEVVSGDQADDDEGNTDGDSAIGDRQWLIQCKRERSINPAKLRRYLAQLPDVKVEQLHGVIFVAACDFSKTARDLFYATTRKNGFMEVKLWGKAEIEDQLFQPKNDNLLFAYFGVSLQVRRRTLKTAIRSRLTTKRKAEKYLSSYKSVLIRDASDDRYPYPDINKRLPRIERRRWKVFQCAGCHHDGVYFTHHRYYAYMTDDYERWDAEESLDQAKIHYSDDPWCSQEERHDWHKPTTEHERSVREKWEALPAKNKAWLEYFLVLPFDNILAIDEVGDEIMQSPHIYVADFNDITAPFNKLCSIKFENCQMYGRRQIPRDETKRVAFFPVPTPETTAVIEDVQDDGSQQNLSID